MKQVVIVGGGILALSTAYYLQRSGQAQVTLLEAGSFAAGTTSQAAALLTRARSALDDGRMVDETHSVIRQFERETQQHFMQRVGCLHIADNPSSLAALEQHQQQAEKRNQNLDFNNIRNQQLSTQWLTAAQIRMQLPWLALSDKSVGLWYPDDGHGDPYILANHYAQAAKLAGAVLRQRTRITQLIERNGRIVGVYDQDKKEYLADAVLLAAGPWTSVLAAQHGVKLGMAPVRSHYWITNPQSLVQPQDCMAIVPDSKAYFRAENKRLLLGVRDSQQCVADPNRLPLQQQDIHSFRFEHDEKGWLALEENWHSLIAACPLLEHAQLNHYLTGVSSYTPDGLPLLGETSQWKNLFIATGCSGAGIAWSGGIGRLLSELMLDEAPFVDATRYALDRFQQQFSSVDSMNEAFRKICADARINKKTG